MKTQIACLLAPLALLPVQSELQLAVEEGATLTKTFVGVQELDLESMSMSVGDQEVPAEHFEEMEFSIEETRTVVLVDEYLELGEGRPTKLRRTYDELSVESVESSDGPRGSDGQSSKDESALEGTSVLFTWDADEEEYSVEFDDEEGDGDLLEALVADADLLMFLPDGEVEEGDSWDVDAILINALLAPGGLMSFMDEDGDSIDTELALEIDENVEGEITATFEGLRDVDGRELAVISLEIDVTTEGDEETENEAGVTEASSVELAMELEGELLWDIDAGHIVGYDISGDVESTVTTTGSFGEQDFEREMELAGTMTLTLEVETE
ncbi:MAG: hypothetical protein ACI8QZ_001327 [Chlamydiales bacterium]|jgi:hypothetical protein